jgi:hypothetical protein
MDDADGTARHGTANHWASHAGRADDGCGCCFAGRDLIVTLRFAAPAAKAVIHGARTGNGADLDE